MNLDLKTLVEDFINCVKTNNLDVEAVLLSDKNGILLEEHFTKGRARSIYSHTKSFTSILAGIAIDEGKLSLDSKVGEILKDEVFNRDFKEITLKDLLIMSSGLNKFLLGYDDVRTGKCGDDWFKYLQTFPIEYEHGTKFCYNNGDTHIVSRMIEKVYGKNLNAVAYEKLFKPLGIGYPIWESDPSNHTNGASNLFLTIEQMNKLGRLLINDGVWENKQIISKKYIDMCFKKQIDVYDQNNNLTPGYSFQFWLNDFASSIRADGAFGQITYISPKYNFALSIQCPEYGTPEKTAKYLKEIIFDKLPRN